MLWEAIQVKNSSSALVHWDDPERWDGEGGVEDGEYMYTPKADSCQCMAKTTTIL